MTFFLRKEKVKLSYSEHVDLSWTYTGWIFLCNMTFQIEVFLFLLFVMSNKFDNVSGE